MIEHIFGVLKNRFRILLLAPEYDLHLQARIPAAACTIHNFIREHDEEIDQTDDDDSFDLDSEAEDDNNYRVVVPTGAGIDHNTRRDQIAELMWAQYQQFFLRGTQITMGMVMTTVMILVHSIVQW